MICYDATVDILDKKLPSLLNWLSNYTAVSTRITPHWQYKAMVCFPSVDVFFVLVYIGLVALVGIRWMECSLFMRLQIGDVHHKASAEPETTKQRVLNSFDIVFEWITHLMLKLNDIYGDLSVLPINILWNYIVLHDITFCLLAKINK